MTSSLLGNLERQTHTHPKPQEIEMDSFFPGYFDSLNQLSPHQKELIEKIKSLYEKIEITEKNEKILNLLNEYFSSLNSLKNELEIDQKVECFDIGFYLYQSYRALNKEIFIKTYPNYYKSQILPLAKAYIASVGDLHYYLEFETVRKTTLIEKVKKVMEHHINFTNAVVKGVNKSRTNS